MQRNRILIVDDEKECCNILQNYFTKWGYEADVGYDGEQAKELLSFKKYDYVLFDCNMPHVSGVDLIKIIKNNNPEAKKIMISGYLFINEDFVKDLGVDLFLRKPITLEEIKEALEKL